MTHEAFIENAGQRVLIAPAVGGLALDLFRGQVIDRTDELPGSGQAADARRLLGQAEVGQVAVVAAGAGLGPYVGGLDVAMHETALMGHVQRFCYLANELRSAPRFERSLL